MTIVPRMLTASLLVGLMAPRLVLAGGLVGMDPYDVGEKLYAKKHYRTALKYYQKALDRDDVRAHYRMGRIYEEYGKEQEALGQYRRFVDRAQPDAQRSDAVQRVEAMEARQSKKAARSTELLERGKSLFKKRKFREAEEVLLQAASRDKARPEIHFYLGEVYMALEEYGKAKSAYIKAKGYY